MLIRTVNHCGETIIKRIVRSQLISSMHKGYSLTTTSNLEYLYGISPIQSALAAGKRSFQALSISDSETINISPRLRNIVKTAQHKNIPIKFVKKERMSRMVGNQPHQNVILKCSQIKPKAISPEGNFSFADNVYVYCDKITDPQNLGSILRSCLFFGVHTVFIPRKHSCPLTPTVSKTSAGALQLIDIYVVSKQEHFLEQWKEDSGFIISTQVSMRKSPVIITQLSSLIAQNKWQKILVMLGSEGSGVSEHLARHAHIEATIPRAGSSKHPYSLVDSLNVNAALTCFLHELTRKEYRIS